MNKKKWRDKIDIANIKSFLIKHKVSVIAGISVILLACISIYFSYAFYQVRDEETIIGGKVGKIADLEVRVMAQNRDENGKAIEGYSLYPYIPKAGYQYNEAKSYCTNGATIQYSNYEAVITAARNDICYLYFDSIANLDITLNVYAENVNSDGKGTGEYTKLETTALPSVGYEFNQEKSSCKNGATLSYSPADNLFSVEASGKDVCNAYMDALDVDIALSLFVQAKKGSSTYYEASTIPTNNFYVINTEKSSCTGSSTLTMENQKVVINATSKTICQAYLDVGNGTILESLSLDNSKLSVRASNAGSIPSTYFYSTDGGNTYNESTDNNINVNASEVSVYAVDAAGNESAVVTTNGYTFNGLYPFKSNVQSKVIEETGYYLLETWGAQGGSYNEEYALGGKGGYSKGIVHLNAGDTLYIHTGGKGTYFTNTDPTKVGAGGANGGGNAGYRGGTGGGGTDIRINNDDLLARVIVAGGGGGAFAYDDTYKAVGGAGGGNAGMTGAYYSSSYSTWVGGAATQNSGGAAGSGSSEPYNGKSGGFGIGADTGQKAESSNYYSNGAGGGGWYGGGSAANYNGSSRTRAAGGGGGSGYVYTTATASLYPTGCLLNEAYLMVNASTTSGTNEFLSPEGISEAGHTGDGYAKVTYIGASLE